jgi:flagellar hook-length control protein FliK
MNAPTVETFVPQIASVPRTRSSQNTSHAKAGKASFDRCLKSASEKPAPANDHADHTVQTPLDKTERKPEQAHTDDPGTTNRSEESDLGKEVTTLTTAELLLNILPDQKAVEVEVEFEPAEMKPVTIPVAVIDPQQTGANPAGEVIPTGQAGVTKTESAQQTEATQVQTPQAETPQSGPLQNETPRLEIPQAAETHAPAASGTTPEAAPQLSEATDELPLNKQDQPPEQGLVRAEEAKPQATARWELSKPVTHTAAVPENPAADERGAIALYPGEQIPAEVGRANSAGSAQAASDHATALPVEDTEVIGQVVRGASMMVNQGRTEVRVRLHPPELGTVRVELASDRSNVVEARIVAERDEVRSLIERNLPQLRESLSASGVQVGTFDVSAEDPGRTPFDGSAQASTSGLARDAVEQEREELPESSLGPIRGVNRSASADGVDYVI